MLFSLRRPDASRRQRRRLPSCPAVIALVSLNCSGRNVYDPHNRVSFTVENMPWCSSSLRKGNIKAWAWLLLCHPLLSPLNILLDYCFSFPSTLSSVLNATATLIGEHFVKPLVKGMKDSMYTVTLKIIGKYSPSFAIKLHVDT